MSTIYQNQEGSIKYNYSIKCRIGHHQLRSSLKTKSRQIATRIKNQIDDIEIDARLNPHRVDDYVARFWILMGKEDEHRKHKEAVNPKFLDAYEKCYMGKLRDEVITESTLHLYKDFHKNLLTLFELHKVKDLKLHSFNQEMLDNLMEYFKDQEYSPTTKNMRLRLLRCFLNWCIEREMIAVAPFKIPKVKEPIKKPSFLYPDDFQKILDNTTSLMQSYFHLYRATGLRRSEMFNFEEIVRSNGTWLMVRGKGNKERVVHVPDDMKDHWNTIKANPVKAHSITRAFSRACKGAGLQARLHDLRHTFAFTQVAIGIDPFTLQMKMGHSDFKTTQVYLQVDREMLMDLISDQNKLLDESRVLA